MGGGDPHQRKGRLGGLGGMGEGTREPEMAERKAQGGGCLEEGRGGRQEQPGPSV